MNLIDKYKGEINTKKPDSLVEEHYPSKIEKYYTI